VRVFGEIGNRRPIYVGASGKLLLAHASEDVQRRVLASERTAFTPLTPVSDTQLKREIVRILAQGYASSMGERVVEVRSIAVPIRDASAVVIASLGISAPRSRMTEAALLATLPALQAAALSVSSALGHSA
jgi:IclR family transcriptional regulator, KDG regulon repressor